MFRNNQKNKNVKATVIMLIATVFFSFLAPLFYWGEFHRAPFLFNGIMQLCAAATCVAFVAIKFRDAFFNKHVRSQIYSKFASCKIFFVIFGVLDYTFYTFSLKYIDVSIAAIIYNTQTFFVVFLISWLLHSSENRYQKITRENFCFLLFAIIGVAFVIISETGESNDKILAMFSDFSVTGIVLIFVATFCASLITPLTLKWGVDIVDSMDEYKGNERVEWYFSIIALAFARLCGGIFSLFVGFTQNTLMFVDRYSVAIAIICGVAIPGVASMLYRSANLATKNLGVNAIIYLSPVFALCFLWLLGFSRVMRVDFFLIGGVAIITANLLINFAAEIRLAYKSLVIALWTGGTFVYFFGEFPLSDYSSTIAVFATVFILILSFRVDRLVRRTTNEEEIMLSLWQKISLLETNNSIVEKVRLHFYIMKNRLLEIDSSQSNQSLKLAYDQFKRLLSRAKRRIDSTYQKDLSAIEKDVDILANSKQQGTNFGEIIALAGVGGVLIVALLFFQPEGIEGNAEIFVKMSSFIIAAVVVFLFFNIFDLQNDRKNSILKSKRWKSGTPSYFSIVFRDAENRNFGRWLSVVVCIVIIIAYIALFGGAFS